MPVQSRRRSSRPSRRERRAGVTRSYTPVTRGPLPATVPVPSVLDRETEFAYTRRDLLRILVWAMLLIALMIVLSFLPLTEWLAA
ncbi:hypothetical protein [Kallotenue papyrolyticum]|uniref:hypothetical protein n=1 Tax=Kallotenue papyrolyticum TaxID=1325125 RepID=UPI000492DD4F|nr:hypothetical protein [Kallotenue papyrolyticum]